MKISTLLTMTLGLSACLSRKDFINEVATQSCLFLVCVYQTWESVGYANQEDCEMNYIEMIEENYQYCDYNSDSARKCLRELRSRADECDESSEFPTSCQVFTCP